MGGGQSSNMVSRYMYVHKVTRTQITFIKNVLESSILWLDKRLKMRKTPFRNSYYLQSIVLDFCALYPRCVFFIFIFLYIFECVIFEVFFLFLVNKKQKTQLNFVCFVRLLRRCCVTLPRCCNINLHVTVKIH